MNTRDKGILIRRMGEAAALSPDDPERRSVEAEIAHEGRWAENEWLELLRFDEHVRIGLRRVPMPAGLEARLLSIQEEPRPEVATTRPPWWKNVLEFITPRPPLFPWVAAVTAFILLLAGLAFHSTLRETSTGRRIREVGLSALVDHAARKPLTVETGNESVLLASLGPTVHFKPMFPKLGPGFRLLGGRRCTLAGRPVIYTRWEKSGFEYSLCLFCPKDFDLPTDFPGLAVIPREKGVKGEREELQALVWAESGCAFVLVAESGGFTPGLTADNIPISG